MVKCDVYWCPQEALHFNPAVGVCACHHHAKEFDRTGWPKLENLILWLTRMQNNLQCGWTTDDGTHWGQGEFDGLFIATNTNIANAWGSMIQGAKPFGFGKYEVKMRGWQTDQSNAGSMIGFERQHGKAPQGLLNFCHTEAPAYLCQSSWTATEYQAYTGLDWSSAWRKYQFDWQANSVKFYIDGALKYTNTTQVPQTPMCFFIELYCGGSPPAQAWGLRIKDLKRLPSGFTP